MFKLSLILLIGLFALTALGQSSPPASASKSTNERSVSQGWPSVSTLPASDPFESLDGRFRISLPKDIDGFAALSPKQTGSTATGQQFTWKFAEGDIVIVYMDFPDSSLSGTSEELSQLTKTIQNSISKELMTAKLISENESVVDGLPVSSSTYALDDGKGYINIRLLLDKKRLYRFHSGFASLKAGTKIESIYKTFKIIPPSEVEEQKQKNYEALKPNSLPQTPIVAKEKSDSNDKGLKGKVRKVITESEDRSGTWAVQGKKLSSVDYYDESGALLQSDSYDSQGNPFQITMYGYIDGKRVSTSKFLRHTYDPPPAMAPPSAKKIAAPRKAYPKYEYSWEYKYQDGKLIESQMYYNDGKKGMRYVYKHIERQVEKLVYTEDGDLNQKFLITLDEEGNEIERTDFGLFNFDIYGDRKYRYSYEFDEEGNWIKRTTATEVKKDGVTSFQPSSISYRTITYY